ncbi:MAG TPA: DinB family protein [Fimbriimonadaceae bacterium]|nr:DinB family protein [Fimbriimonadaceae bacterium]
MDPTFLEALLKTPDILERMVALIPASRWDERPDPERFSAREVLAHIADYEPIYLSRMQTAFETNGGAVIAFDPDELAASHRYHESDPAEMLKRIREDRAIMVGWLQGLDADDFKKSYVHPLYGTVSIREAAEDLAAHDLYHLEQLSHVLGEKMAGTW